MAKLSPEELAVYREPYPDPVSRRPLQSWPREIPIDGDPPEVADLMAAGAANLTASPIPKLFSAADPGVISRPRSFSGVAAA